MFPPYPLEWKFIEFSGLFHCLIIKVRFVRSHKRLRYLITLFSTCQVLFFKVFQFFSMCSVLSNSLFILPQLVSFVNLFFLVFQTFWIVRIVCFFCSFRTLCYLITSFCICQQLFLTFLNFLLSNFVTFHTFLSKTRVILTLKFILVNTYFKFF